MKYSIITINYNNREGLRRTIESVICQSYKKYEFIVIDGGSSDGSVDVIQEYMQHITYWESKKDRGIYNAMNKGIIVAQGDFLIFMNSGDIFYNNNVLEKSLPYLHYDIVQGIAKNDDLSETPLCLVKIPNKTELFSPSLHHQSCYFRKELFRRSLYDENFKIISDWKFYIEQIILYNCSYVTIPIDIAIYEGGGISDTEKNREYEERLIVIENLVKSLKRQKLYDKYKEMLLHIMFTTKQRFLLNKQLFDLKKYYNTFPESNKYYKYYPFSKKQKLLFFLANHHMSFFINLILKSTK